MDHYFTGSALGIADRQGRIALPAFVRSALARCSDAASLLLVRHEADPCLMGFDRVQLPGFHAELERRRLRDEAAGGAAGEHHARARRLFGLASEAGIDGRGRIVLPELERRRLGIGREVLFLGAGATFEIWSAARAAACADEAVADAARFHLAEAGLADAA